MSSAVTSAGSIHLRLIELNAELLERRKLSEDPKLMTSYRVTQHVECRVLEAKIVALNQALSDLEAAR